MLNKCILVLFVLYQWRVDMIHGMCRKLICHVLGSYFFRSGVYNIPHVNCLVQIVFSFDSSGFTCGQGRPTLMEHKTYITIQSIDDLGYSDNKMHHVSSHFQKNVLMLFKDGEHKIIQDRFFYVSIIPTAIRGVRDKAADFF